MGEDDAHTCAQGDGGGGAGTPAAAGRRHRQHLAAPTDAADHQ
ncbi:hypothetical protein [Kribbella qitaiheensis]|nr:hypothetical protein [Kribbella qitaiheensis]